jgi:sphinganine-1-phosphate aldolase
MRKTLPTEGRDWAAIEAEMTTRAEGDVDWRAGKTAVYVFNAGDDVRDVAKNAYGMFMSENGLGPAAFPSLQQMEQDVVDFGLDLLQAPDGAAGCMTSGGTDSIFMALKTCRDFWRAEGRDTAGANIVVPQSAHPAFNKAGHLLDIDVNRVPLAKDFTADVSAMKASVDDKTMMLVGSAPCFPFGLIDPIADLSDLAVEKDIWLHVDACVGGYFAPFARMNGVNLPAFDFALPGVRSMSADLHKYGYTAKGASTVLYRSAEIFDHQIFRFGDWPNGMMITPTLAGTRPGGAIAAAWAVMNYLGTAGYRQKAADVIQARQKIEAGLQDIGDLDVYGGPQLGLICFGSDVIDILAVAERMMAKGWISARTQSPPGLHLMLSPKHLEVADDYLADLREAVGAVRQSGQTAKETSGFYN